MDVPEFKPYGGEISGSISSGFEAHPASCTMGTGSFPEVKRPNRDADHSLPSSAVVEYI
jgi:hypothetical protein